jgi:hypothetical protein
MTRPCLGSVSQALQKSDLPGRAGRHSSLRKFESSGDRLALWIISLG